MTDAANVLSILDYVTAAGEPVSGGSIEFYQAGTSTARTVYSDSALTVSLGTIVYTDSEGFPVSTQGGSTRISIYTGTGAYKVVVKNSSGTTLFTRDNIPGALDTSGFDTTSALPTVPVSAKTAAYTITTNDRGYLFNCNPTGGTFVMTLPSAVTAGDNFTVGIRHNGTANQVTLAAVSSQNIRGPGTPTSYFSLVGRGEEVWLASDGADWIVTSYVPALIRPGHLPPPLLITDRLTAAPSSPTAGARYIVNGSPTGTWSTLGFAQNDIAEADGNGGWIKYTPAAGWRGYVLDEDVDTRFDGSAWDDLSNVTAPTTSTLKQALFLDQRADGTVGGTATTGVYTTAAINTQVFNSITGCSLASNLITLPAGTFEVTAKKFMSGGNSQGIRLKLANGGTPIYYYGINANLSSAEKPTAHAEAQFTLASSDTLSLEYYSQSSADTTDLGEALTLTGVPETYASINIQEKTAQQGPTGAQGAQGTDGLDAGHSFQWSGATTGDPGAGKIRGNNVTFYSSISELAVSKTDALTASVGDVVATWDDSTSSNRATVKISKESAPQNYIALRVSGSGTDHGTYWSFPVTYVGSYGTFAHGEGAAVSVAEKGDKGDTGATGSAATASFDYTFSTTTTSGPSTGTIRANHATLSSATALYIHETDRLDISQAAAIAQWDDSTTTAHRGYLTLIDVATPANKTRFEITGANTDNGSDQTIVVTYVSGATSLTAVNVQVIWERTGDKGADGTLGDVGGLSVLPRSGLAHNDHTVVYDASAATTKASYLIGLSMYEPRNPEFGAVGDGATDDRAALAAADTAAAAVGGLLELGPGTYRVNSNLTLSSRVRFTGGILKPASGVTVTLSGEITAPDKQIFDISLGGTIAGSGAITGGCVCQSWWGGVGNGSTNNQPYTAAAVAFLKQRTAAGLYGGVLKFGLGKFVHTSGVTIDFPGCHIEGLGSLSTYILMSGAFTMFTVSGSVGGANAAYGTAFRHLTIDSGAAKPTSGVMIYLQYVQEVSIDHCRFLAPYRAIHCFGCEGPLVKAISHNSFVAPSTIPAIAGSALIYLQGDNASATTGLNERFFIHNNTGGGIGIDYGLWIDGCDTVKATANHFHGPATAVLFISADAGRNCYNFLSTNNTWEGLTTYADYAVRIRATGANKLDAVHFTNDQCLNGTTSMVSVEGSVPHGVSFTSCCFKQADATAVVLEGGTNLKVVGCEFMDANIVNAGTQSFLAVGGASTGPTDVLIAANTFAKQDFAHAVSRGIYLRNGTGISVDGNKIRDVSTAIHAEVTHDAFTCRGNDIGARRSTVASAATISIPLGCDRAYITGTATIVSIDNSGASGSSSFDGREVELIFEGAALVSSGGGNIILAHAVNYTGVANHWLRLRYDADANAWHETARHRTNTFATVEFGDGSATAPSITNVGDTNTGVYFSAADTVNVATAGVMRVEASATGTFGFNVAAQAASASVVRIDEPSGNTTNDTRVTIANSAGNRAALTQSNASNHITMAMGAPGVSTLGDRWGLGMSGSGEYAISVEHGGFPSTYHKNVGVHVNATTARHPLTVGESEAPVTTGQMLGVYKAGATYASLRNTTDNIEAVIGAATDRVLIGSATAQDIGFVVNNTTLLRFTGSVLRPESNDGVSLGVSGTGFADLFLATGAVINFGAGNGTITHSAGALAFGGVAVNISNSAQQMMQILTSDTLGYVAMKNSSGANALLIGANGTTAFFQNQSASIIEMQVAGGGATAKVRAGEVSVQSDHGGVAGYVSLANATDLAPRSTGVGTIKFDDATARDSAGFLKVYVGVTAYYIPLFSAI